MKTSHVIFFLILFLILRNKAAAQPVPAAQATGGDALLRRDMDERFSLLQDQINELKKSPYQ